MANEKRLIDAAPLMEDGWHLVKTGKSNVFLASMSLADVQTVDAEPVVHGRWEQVQRWATKAKYRCSVCGREIISATKVNIEKYPYCHCGAKMDGDVNG